MFETCLLVEGDNKSLRANVVKHNGIILSVCYEVEEEISVKFDAQGRIYFEEGKHHPRSE